MTTGNTDRAPRRGHTYVDRGPLPGTSWDTPEYRKRLAAVSRLLRELHEAAGRPPATELCLRVGISNTAVSQLLSGRRMPSWRVVHTLAIVLASDAHGDLTVVESVLQAAYDGHLELKGVHK